MAKTKTDLASSCIKTEANYSSPVHEVDVKIEEMSGSNEFDAGCVGVALPFTLVVKTEIHGGNNKVMQGVKTEMPDRTVSDIGSTDTTMFRKGKGGKTSKDSLPYICGVCEKTFNLKRELESHMRRHTEEKPFVCRVCKKRFAHASTLRDHARLHTGLRPYKCEHCDQTYTKQSHLKPHFDRKHSQNVLQCTKCDKTFKTNSDLMKHTRNHDTNVTHRCDVCCIQNFKTKMELNLHISKFHGVKSEKRDKKYCRTPSHAEGQLGKRHICDICQKDFKRKQYLVTHKLSHSNIRPYSCDRCGKAFNDQSNLRRHRLSHDETSMSRQNIIHIEKPRYL